MKKPFLLISLLLLLSPLALAKSSMKVPAVDSSGRGVLTDITVDVQPGEGKVFVDIVPFFSIETQQSSRTAAAAAAALGRVNRSSYNFFYEIVTNADIVDGPSGGAALALLTYGELIKNKPRADLSATGGVNADGSFTKVGGIFEKTHAAGRIGIRVFLVPPGQAIQDGIDLTTYGPERLGVQVIEVKNLEEAAKIAFTTEGTEVQAPRRTVVPLSVPKAVAPAVTAPFKALAEQVVARTEKQVEEMAADGAFYNVSKQGVNTSKYLLAQGFLYSAANEAFVTKTSVEAAALSRLSRAELAARLEQLAADAKKNSRSLPQKTVENIEWSVSADLRHYWALERLGEASEDTPLAPPAQLAQAIAVVENWLGASREFARLAAARDGAGGSTQVDETRLRTHASRTIQEAAALVDNAPDSEAAFHLRTARKAFDDGRYAAASVDGVFARAFARAALDNAEKTPAEASEGLQGIEDGRAYRDSAWAWLYFSHSVYSGAEWNRTGDASDLLNALKLQRLAKEIDAEFKEVRLLARTPVEQPAADGAETGRQTIEPGKPAALEVTIESIPARQQQPLQDVRLLGLAAVVLIALAVVGLAFVLRRKSREMSAVALRDLRKKLDKLDDLLVEERISESNYERVRVKYEAKIEELGAALEAEEEEAEEEKSRKKSGGASGRKRKTS